MKKILLLLLLATTACQTPFILAPYGSVDWVVRIESDTEWTAVVAGVGLSGFGDRTVPLSVYASCWSVRKVTQRGVVRAYAMPAQYLGRPQADIPARGDRATSAPFGAVAGCM